MKFDAVRFKFVKLFLLISMCKENLYAKLEKLEAQICLGVQDRALKLHPAYYSQIYPAL